MNTQSNYPERKNSLLLFIVVLTAPVFFLAGYSDNGTSVEQPEEVEQVREFLQSLPSCNEFAPPESTQPPTPAGEPEFEEDVILDVEVVNDEGTTHLMENVTYSCLSQPFTLTDNPQQIAMYSPDREILYAGGLIQGKSHRDGPGSLFGLPIAERTPINVSITGLANDDNFRTVEQPSQASVDQAIGSMIGGATASGLSTPSSISFKMETHPQREAIGPADGALGQLPRV